MMRVLIASFLGGLCAGMALAGTVYRVPAPLTVALVLAALLCFAVAWREEA